MPRHDLFTYIEGYIAIVIDSTPPPGISRPNRQSAKPLNPASTIGR
jgi:hypothetical protein